MCENVERTTKGQQNTSILEDQNARRGQDSPSNLPGGTADRNLRIKEFRTTQKTLDTRMRHASRERINPLRYWNYASFMGWWSVRNTDV
jgi:hypothetical protein